MGIDAMLFAKKAKKGICFDREYNIRIYTYIFEYENQLSCKDEDFLYDIRSMLSNPKKGVGQEMLLYLLEANLKAINMQTEEDYSDHHTKKLLEFLKKHPNDNYFTVTDHADPPYYEYLKENKGDKIYGHWETSDKSDMYAYEDEGE